MSRKPDPAEVNLSRTSSRVEAETTPPVAGKPRRYWLEIAAIVIGALVGVIPMLAGLVTFLDPLLRRRSVPKGRQTASGGKDGYYRIASLSGLVVGGLPQRFRVIAGQHNAWNFAPDQAIGSVYLHRIGENEVRCFNTTCPHAGCSVECNGTAFVCPCHNSAFNLDGTKKASNSGRENPSPRNMDELAVDLELLKKDEIWVEFKNFYTGRHSKDPKA